MLDITCRLPQCQNTRRALESKIKELQGELDKCALRDCPTDAQIEQAYEVHFEQLDKIERLEREADEAEEEYRQLKIKLSKLKRVFESARHASETYHQPQDHQRVQVAEAMASLAVALSGVE